MSHPFEAVYVINLRRSIERWDATRAMLASVGIDDPIRWDARDGEALEKEEIRQLQREGVLAQDLSAFAPQAMRGEIGCALSHAAVLEEIVERDLTCCLILEDDSEIAGTSEEWPRRLAAAAADLPSGWDLWYLFRCFDVKVRIKRLSPRTVVPWTPLCAAAYAVTADGAKMLLDGVYPIGKAIDRIYGEDVVRRGRIKVFAASPPLMIPGDFPSIINANYGEKEWVENGVNRPPEFWPDQYREALETAPWRRWLFLAMVLAFALAVFLFWMSR